LALAILNSAGTYKGGALSLSVAKHLHGIARICAEMLHFVQHDSDAAMTDEPTECVFILNFELSILKSKWLSTLSLIQPKAAATA
jgi:hypothetical protein